jgi:hypothetical protein
MQVGKSMIVLYVHLHRHSMPSVAACKLEAEHGFLSYKLVAKPCLLQLSQIARTYPHSSLFARAEMSGPRDKIANIV